MSASASADSCVVYVVRCSDDSLYVGHTSNVDKRVIVHNAGRGALWTACRRPVILVYQESRSSADDAIARERQIKRWTHAKKLALINGDKAKLKALADARNVEPSRICLENVLVKRFGLEPSEDDVFGFDRSDNRDIFCLTGRGRDSNRVGVIGSLIRVDRSGAGG